MIALIRITPIKLLLFLLICYSCSTEEPSVEPPEQPGIEIPQKEDLNKANFSFTGELTSKKSTYKSFQSEGTDLFAMQFFDVKTKKPYAHVLGDDLGKINVDFIKGRTYRMKVAYVVDGKEIVSNHEGHYQAPFSRSNNAPSELNKVYYSSDVYLPGISLPGVSLYNFGGTYLEVDRYHGILQEFEVTEDQENIKIDLKRMVFGVELEITLNTESNEPLYFAINPTIGFNREYGFTTNEGTGVLQIPYLTLGFPNSTAVDLYETDMDRAFFSEYSEDVHISIGTPENHIKYFDGKLTVHRNKLVSIELAVEQNGETSQGGLDISFEEEMLERSLDL